LEPRIDRPFDENLVRLSQLAAAVDLGGRLPNKISNDAIDGKHQRLTTMLNYEELMADFNHKLMTQLRGHSADNEYLETWVPDEDPVLSILNMVEAAQSSGLEAMKVHFDAKTMNETQRTTLLDEVSKIAEAQLSASAGGYDLVVSGIKG
jgi:hypothetical protein